MSEHVSQSPAASPRASSDGAPSAPAFLRDDPTDETVLSSETVFEGKIWDVKRDVVQYGDAEMTREYLDHPGAVAILALDDDDNALLIKQYRHPIAARDWELPAGILDVRGESPVDAARRELGEETDLEASTWHLLSEFFTSPGGSNETLRVYLARGITATATPFDRFDEEAELETRWVPLDDVVQAVLERRVTNSILTIAVLAASVSRSRGWSTLGDPEQGWPWHPRLRADPDTATVGDVG